ncbi:hypothetical protein B0H19DRAFT_651284 [Mycena capillaripes]|nr:hypothetical protein B0H19DRAFT_651284 [Mycena capillaripes]
MLAPSFLGLFIVGASALPHGLYSRASVDVKILTQTDGQFEACNAQQIAFINSQVDDCVKQAKDASAALKQADVTTAPSFIDFLPTNEKPATIASVHYDSLVSGVPATLGSTTTVGTGAKDLTFICPAKCKSNKFFAFAINKGGSNSQLVPKGSASPANIVMACPAFFGTDQDTGKPKADAVPQSLTDAGALYTSGQRMGNVPAMTLLHEFQHLEVFVGAANSHPDVKVGGVLAYKKELCVGLSNADRAKNAQSFAWFAFEAAVDPARAKGCPPAPAPAPPAAAVPARPGTPQPVKAAKPATPAKSNSLPREPEPEAAEELEARVTKAKAKAPVKAPAKAPVKAAAPKPVAKPVVKAPVAAKPIAAKPVAVKPVAAKPVAAKPVAVKPVAKPPVKAAPLKTAPATTKAPATAAASCPARNLKTGDISFDFVEFDG